MFLILFAVRLAASEGGLAEAAQALPLMLLLSAVGFAFNNAISPQAMQYRGARYLLIRSAEAPVRDAVVAGPVRRFG